MFQVEFYEKNGDIPVENFLNNSFVKFTETISGWHGYDSDCILAEIVG